MSESVILTASTEEILCFVNSLVNKTAKIAVFGAGNVGSTVQNDFVKNGIEVSYFVDNSPQKQGTDFNGVPVISVEKLKELCAKENIGIFIASIYAGEIFEQLEKEGFARFVVAVEMLDASCFFADYFWYVLECVKRNYNVDCDSAEFQVFPNGEFGKQFDAFNRGGGGKTADCLPEEAERRTAAFIRPLVDKGVKIALFGAGRIGKMKLEEFRSFGIEPSCFIDNFFEKKGTLYCGLPVISVKTLKEIAEKEKICIVIAAASADEIYGQLEEEGLHSLVISDELQQKTIASFSQLRKLFESKVNFGTVLVVEPNNGHGVVVPGYVKYLLDLGYEVDVVITPHNAKLNIFAHTSLLERINNIFVMEIAQIKDLLNQGFRYNDYSAVFLTSEIFYNWEKPALSRKNHFLRICPQIKQDKLLSVSHHQEAQNGLFRKPLVLADFLDGVMVNPHYFGHINPEPKNEITRFISVGEVIDTKSDFPSLIRAVKYLHNDPAYRNRFVITVAGYIIQQQYVPQHLQHYFRWLGYVSTDEINLEMKKADYFLPLLDPDVFAHNRYITIGTSGGFLLIYGFRKLAVLNRQFADKHRLTNENSLLYENSGELADTMKTAIDMSQQEYTFRQKNLTKTANEIYKESLKNLGEVMNRIAPLQKRELEEKQSRKVILHIGTMKTGTTTIQCFLTQNAAELAQRDWFIPLISCFGASEFAALHHFAFTFWERLANWQTDNNSSAYTERIWNDRKSLELQLSGSRGQTVILSCEMFFWFNKQEIDKLRTWIYSYFNEVEVIVYLRRQPELWCSIYSETAKVGERTPALNWNCNYERSCSLWSQFFGKENVKVKIFDRKEMIKNDLVDDFCNAAGIDNTGLVRPKNQNESLDAETAEFMRQLNTYIPLATENGTLNNTLRYKLWGIAEKKLCRAGNKGYLLTRRQAQEIIERHRESNNAVAREFLGREQLFDEDVSMYPEETTPHNLTVEKSVEIAAELLKGLHEIQQQEIQSRDRKVLEETKTTIHSSSGDEQLFHLAEGWKHHNEAEYLKKNNPPHIPNNSKIKIFYYDTYIANACNLKCSQCCHFSPFRTDMPSKEFLIRSYEEWSKRFEPEIITVGGGEPLLRSDLLEVILALRYYFPNPLIQILTNGLLLPKLSDAAIKHFRDAGRIVFRVSNHLNTLEFNNLLEKEKKRFESFGTPFYIHNSYQWWGKFYCSDSQGILPVPAGNPHFITEKCYGKAAFYGEKVFYCCLVANAYNAVQEGILNKEWDFLRKYKPMTLANTQQQIFDYLTQNVIPECSMCPEDQFETRVPPRQLTASEGA